MSQTLCYPGHILQTFYTLLCLRILRYFEYFCFVWTTHIICTQVTIHESCVTSSWEGSWQCSPWRKPGIQNDSLTRWRGWPRMQHFNLFPTSPWKSVSNNAGSSPTEAEIQRCHAQQCMKDSQGTPDLQWDDVNHVALDTCRCLSTNLFFRKSSFETCSIHRYIIYIIPSEASLYQFDFSFLSMSKSNWVSAKCDVSMFHQPTDNRMREKLKTVCGRCWMFMRDF